MSSAADHLPSDLQSLVHREMARGGYQSTDDLLREALNYWAEHRDTVAAIEEGLADIDAGRVQSLDEFDREFRVANGFPPAE